MQTIRNRQISRQMQQYYGQMDDLISTQNMIRQTRNDGSPIGYPIGLSAVGEMDADKRIGIVRGNPPYWAYLRTSRQWAAIHLASTDDQTRRASAPLAETAEYSGQTRSARQ